MAFRTTWDTTYEGLPPDSEDRGNGATRIRNLKQDIRERTAVDHSWAGNADDGKHNYCQFLTQTAKPTLASRQTAVYTKNVAGDPELFFEDVNGNEVELTNAGKIAITPVASDGTGSTFFQFGTSTYKVAISVDGVNAITYLYFDYPRTYFKYTFSPEKVELFINGVVKQTWAA